ncbi:cytochrome P450 [Kibdelosporangium philippinense]|uniref:Cytochrome P450 n=1 Tax=Kibdelosporangium philippinense TaxID=211113 RepID=A0ABS8ZMJ8_9PSEU|nr:cytochrome P450 [Kibdelosporangium philippinense]MCE7009006.1 cytochrome P450 [Kibdelosporangium philippinense]
MLSFSDVRGIATALTTRAAARVLAEAGDLIAATDTKRFHDNPYPVLERMRAKGPVYRGLSGMYALTSHSLISQALKHPQVKVQPLPGKRDPFTLGTNALEGSFVVLDAPDHTRLRRITAPAFRPKMMRELRGRIEATTHRLLDHVGTEFDLMADFANPLPITVISDLLGIPANETGRFARYGMIIAEAFDGLNSPAKVREYNTAYADIRQLFSRLMAERRVDPGDDVISILVAAETEDRMTADEFMTTCMLLLIAGFETTVNMIGNAAVLFSEHPEQWELLKAQPDLATNVVEEVLRYESPVPVLMRFTHDLVQLDGGEVPAGASVLFMLGAANRDPAVFPEPHRFDITRSGSVEHLAFGGGVHYCLGAPLSRLEGDVAFRAMAERFATIKLNGVPARRLSSSIRGFSAIPVRV